MTIHARETSDGTVIEWDNRDHPVNGCMAIFLTGFLLVWIPVAAWLTYQFFFNGLQIPLLMVIGFNVGAVLIPVIWVARRVPERIVLNPSEYRHEYHSLFALLQNKRWPIQTVSTIQIGFFRPEKPKWLRFLPNNPDSESFISLNVNAGPWKRDMVAWMLRDDLKHAIFLELQTAAKKYGLTIQFVDDIGDWIYKTYPRPDGEYVDN